jgi:hypothetical protein
MTPKDGDLLPVVREVTRADQALIDTIACGGSVDQRSAQHLQPALESPDQIGVVP